MDSNTHDAAVLKRYLAGDTNALDELVDRYRGPLYGYIYNMTRGQDDADEIFQETWFRALRCLQRYKQNNFLGWLVRIAHNLVIDRARRCKPGFSLDEELFDDSGASRRDRQSADEPTPHDNTANRELSLRIRQAVDSLPPEQREVFLLRQQADMPFREIAEIQKISINTALARMQYALRKLRDILQNDYDQLARYASGD